jgi:Tol biopolymer transport system component
MKRAKRTGPPAAGLAASLALLVAFSSSAPACKGKSIFGRSTPTPRNLPPSSDTFVFFVHDERAGKEPAHLFSASAAGGEPKRACDTALDSEAMDPQFSPDGKKIAFAAGHARRQRVYVMNKDCTDVKKLAELPSLRSFEGLTWSPDGKVLAALAEDERIDYGHVAGPTLYHLVTIDASTGTQRDLGSVGMATGPAFTPDGQSLVFTSTTASFSADEEEKRDDHELGIVRIDGSGRRALMKSQHLLRDPSVFVDGRIVLVMMTKTKKKTDPSRAILWEWIRTEAIVTYNADGSGEDVVFDGAKVKSSRPSGTWLGFYRPGFTPDGTRIFFEESLSLTHVVTFDGKIERSVEGYRPQYSRDGRVLVTWEQTGGVTSPGPLRTSVKGASPSIAVKSASSGAAFGP